MQQVLVLGLPARFTQHTAGGMISCNKVVATLWQGCHILATAWLQLL